LGACKVMLEVGWRALLISIAFTSAALGWIPTCGSFRHTSIHHTAICLIANRTNGDSGGR
jgi:hypothetical protein